jgi:hypothetical protein
MDCASSGISGRAGLEPGDGAAARGEGARLSGRVQHPEAAPREGATRGPLSHLSRRANTGVCQYFWRKSSRILLCPAASLVISALPMKAEPFAQPNPDQDLAAASDAPGIPEDLLIVGDVGLEDSNGARDQQYDDTQRNENLHYSE